MSAAAYAWIWIVLALLALLAELHSRTLYLLALAAALGTAAALDLLGFGLDPQLAALALVCLAGFPVAAWFRHRQGRAAALVSADIGREVSVVALGPPHLRVFYRGTEWEADYCGPAVKVGDRLRISGLHGSILQLVESPGAPCPSQQT